MIYKFSFLEKSDFNKNVFSLFKGVFIAQLISIIGALILAKIYGNESFGFYNVFLSISGVFTILFTLNLEQTIVISKSNIESRNIFNSLFYLTLFITTVFLIIISILQVFYSFLIDNWMLILGSIGALLIANKNIIEMFLTRIKLFKIQSQTRVLTAFLTLLFQGGLYYLFPLNGLIYGYLLSILIILFYLILYSKETLFVPTFSEFIESVKKYKNLITFGLTSNFINSVANNILPILIASFFSFASTGVYALSLKIVLAPMLLLSSSVAQVYFQKASEIYHSSYQNLYDFTKKIVIANLLIMFIILIIINTLGIFLLKIFFNKGWENLEFYVLILSFYILCRVTFNPISHLITILNRLKTGLVFNIYLVLINIIAIYLGYLYQDLKITVVIFSFFGGLGYLILLKHFLSLLKKTK